MRSTYGFEWLPGAAILGGVLALLIVPPFALIALALVAVAALAAVLALAGAILASPFLIVRTVRRRLAERHQPAKATVSMATPITALAGPTTARSSR